MDELPSWINRLMGIKEEAQKEPRDKTNGEKNQDI
jgi:hypothetical protein